jgi:hypothetical protein
MGIRIYHTAGLNTIAIAASAQRGGFGPGVGTAIEEYYFRMRLCKGIEFVLEFISWKVTSACISDI